MHVTLKRAVKLVHKYTQADWLKVVHLPCMVGWTKAIPKKLSESFQYFTVRLLVHSLACALTIVTTGNNTALSSGVCRMKRIWALLLPPGWDAIPSQDNHPAWSDWEYYYFPLDGKLVHHRVPRIKCLGVLLYYSPLDGKLFHHRLITQHEMTGSRVTTLSWIVSYSITGLPPIILPNGSLVPIYAPGWRETKCSKFSCLKKQRDTWSDQARTTEPLTLLVWSKVRYPYPTFMITEVALTAKW